MGLGAALRRHGACGWWLRAVPLLPCGCCRPRELAADSLADEVAGEDPDALRRAEEDREALMGECPAALLPWAPPCLLWHVAGCLVSGHLWAAGGTPFWGAAQPPWLRAAAPRWWRAALVVAAQCIPSAPYSAMHTPGAALCTAAADGTCACCARCADIQNKLGQLELPHIFRLFAFICIQLSLHGGQLEELDPYVKARRPA